MNAIMMLHRAQMGAQSNGGGPAYMEHLIGAYTFEGRSNDDEDRAVILDKSGNGNTLSLVDMNWGNGDSYTLTGFYDDYLCLAPRNGGYGIINYDNALDAKNITIIYSADSYGVEGLENYGATIGSEGYNDANTSPIYMQYSEYGVVYSRCVDFRISKTSKYPIVNWMNYGYFNNQPMQAIAVKDTQIRSILVGRIRSSIPENQRIKVKCIYIFNTNLDPADIEHFIINNIDPTYTLP